MYHIIKLCILPTECLYVFDIILPANSDCFRKEHQEAGLCTGDVMCLLWGKNWNCVYYLEEFQCLKGKKVKLSMYRPWRPLGLRELRLLPFQTFSSHMVARSSDLHAGRFLPPGKFLVLISVRGWVDPRAIMRMEGLGTLKKIHLIRDSNRWPSSINHLRYRMPLKGRTHIESVREQGC
jgi:hypothetical protein